MKNIWVRCLKIKWEEERYDLPSYKKALVIAPEWVEDNINAAIDKQLEKIYKAKGHCERFIFYDEEESEKLDLAMLMGGVI